MNSLTFLGTGTSQGIPVIGSNHPVCNSINKKDKRLRSSVLYSVNNKNILIDCGPDFRYQMLSNNINHIDSILFTHEHNDHVLGLDDIRPIVFRSKKNMPIYANGRVLNELKKRFPYIYEPIKYFGIPSVDEHEIINEFLIDEIKIEPINIMHGRLPILGFKIFNTAYITDASYIADEEKSKIKNLDILIINSLRKEPEHFSHFTLNQTLEVIKELAPKKAYITHISHQLGFHDEVQNELPENVFLSYDGLTLNF
ncbi:MAG: MBL fold metallo-hydrolase [Solirubrobacteraceae bacterium]